MGGKRHKTVVRFNEKGEWKMPRIHVHEHKRPRIWYIVVANCGKLAGNPSRDDRAGAGAYAEDTSTSSGVIKVAYNAKFVNQGPQWKKEFGVNEQGLNILFGLFFLLYLGLCCSHVLTIREYRQRGSYHPLIQLLSITLFSQLLYLSLLCCHTLVFTFDGIGVKVFKLAGEVCALVSRLSLLLLLMLLAQGWGTVNISIQNRDGLQILLGMFLLCYGLLLFWDISFRDPASTLYMYESYPGLLVLLLDVFATLWFAKAMYTLAKKREIISSSKAAFLNRVGVCYMAYLISIPVTVTIACFLSPWVREVTVTSINTLVTLLAHGGLMFLLWPWRAELYFKLEARTAKHVTDKAERDSEQARLL